MREKRIEDSPRQILDYVEQSRLSFQNSDGTQETVTLSNLLEAVAVPKRFWRSPEEANQKALPAMNLN